MREPATGLVVSITFNDLDLAGSCTGPGVAMSCPRVPAAGLDGALVGSAPRDWSFSCSNDADGVFVSVGGHLVQVRG